MKHLLPPDTWRSEAFAEDLFDEQRRQPPRSSPLRTQFMSNLVGLLPVAIGLVGAVIAAWHSAA